MGTDNLHKRKLVLRSRVSKKQPYEVILIVCEGEKTEINYLKQLKDFFRLNNVAIDILSSKNPSPLQVVEFAQKNNKRYDKVYCVFDKDTHSTFDEALQKCKKYNFEAIVSNPCFEFWILLHFACTTKPFGTNSPCSELINNDLKKYIKDYTKNYNFANIIRQNLDIAIVNVQKANKEAEKNNYGSPYTFMDKLALKFQELNNAK